MTAPPPEEIAATWQDIETAPRDGTRLFMASVSRWRGESRIDVAWWQPEFDAFITGAREMQMHNGYTFEDGATRRLHSPDVFPATHWLCAVPSLPALKEPNHDR